MSAQIIELIFLAAVAFLVIGKLISILGTTDEDGGKSFFGESSTVIKDVTGSVKKFSVISLVDKKKKRELSQIFSGSDPASIEASIAEICARMPSFDPFKFVNNSKKAFAMIFEACATGREGELESLVDKRFMESFKEQALSYGELSDPSKLEAKISEIYTFGNNVFVKIFFKGKDVLSGIKNLKEEWVFTRSFTSGSEDWYLSNIDRNV